MHCKISCKQRKNIFCLIFIKFSIKTKWAKFIWCIQLNRGHCYADFHYLCDKTFSTSLLWSYRKFSMRDTYDFVLVAQRVTLLCCFYFVVRIAWRLLGEISQNMICKMFVVGFWYSLGVKKLKREWCGTIFSNAFVRGVSLCHVWIFTKLNTWAIYYPNFHRWKDQELDSFII